MQVYYESSCYDPVTVAKRYVRKMAMNPGMYAVVEVNADGYSTRMCVCSSGMSSDEIKQKADPREFEGIFGLVEWPM